MDIVADMNYFTIQEDFKNLELSVGGSSKKSSDRLGIGIVTGSDAVVSSLPTRSKHDSSGSKLSCTNRRYTLRPRKRTSTGPEGSDSDDLVNFFNNENKRPKLDLKSAKSKYTRLETIFEEPVVKKNGSLVLVGKTKVKRSIAFDFVTQAKLKKRKAQMKKFKVKLIKSHDSNCTLKDVQSKVDELINKKDLV